MSAIDNLTSRLKSIAKDTLGKSSDGVCFVTFSVFLDCRGEPLMWYIEKRSRLEPAAGAKAILQQIFSASEVDKS